MLLLLVHLRFQIIVKASYLIIFNGMRYELESSDERYLLLVSKGFNKGFTKGVYEFFILLISEKWLPRKNLIVACANFFK